MLHCSGRWAADNWISFSGINKVLLYCVALFRSVGCILYELCAQDHAFNGQGLMGVMYKIVEGDAPELPKKYSKELNAVLKKCVLFASCCLHYWKKKYSKELNAVLKKCVLFASCCLHYWKKKYSKELNTVLKKCVLFASCCLHQ